MNFLKIQSWQGKVLAVVAVMVAGMLLRDTVQYLFKSLYTLITTDWTAMASESLLIAVAVLISSVVISNRGKHEDKSNNRPAYQGGQNQNQNR
jgi:hypothetical protein